MGADHRPPGIRRGVLFFGEVVAGLSHELSNVFTIINEMAGLQQDIIAGESLEPSAAADRLGELAGRIKRQVERGEGFNRRLHSLAHSVDEAVTTVDLGEAVELAGSLAARRARLAGVELAVRLPEAPVSLEGDPFALVLTVCSAIGAVVDAADSERRVEVNASARDRGARITLISADPLPSSLIDESAAAFEIGRSAWGATFKLDRPSDASHSVILELPAVAPVGAAAANDAGLEDAHAT